MKNNHKAILQELYNHPSLDKNNGLKISVIKERFDYGNLDDLLKDLKKWGYITDSDNGMYDDYSVRLTKEGQELMKQKEFGIKIDIIKRATIIAAIASSIGALYTILSYYFK